MKTLLRQALRSLAALTLATAACAPAAAVTLPFNASYSGVANVVEVIDETVPVLRFRTFASGVGSLDLGSYFSTDVIDMSTGAGAGFNIFTAANGDELHGSFNVQVIPTAAANVVDLIGQATFTGGTGLFSGASGSALFSGTGVFTSATSAVADLTFGGEIALVPEPGSWLLMSAGMVALVLRRPRRTSQ
jgi:hypothetical protein